MRYRTRVLLSRLIATFIVLAYIGIVVYIGFTYGVDIAEGFVLLSMLAVFMIFVVLHSICILAESIEELSRRFF